MAERHYDDPIRIGKGKFSYLHMDRPSSFKENADKYYSFDFVFPKDDKATVAKVVEAEKKAVSNALADRRITKEPKAIPSFTRALLDGDKKLDSQGEPDPVYANCWYLKCREKQKFDDKGNERPGPSVYVIDLGKADQRPNPKLGDIIWSGMEGYCTVTISLTGDDSKAWLRPWIESICKTGDGKRIGTAHDSFEDYSDIYESNAPDAGAVDTRADKPDDLGL